MCFVISFCQMLDVMCRRSAETEVNSYALTWDPFFICHDAVWVIALVESADELNWDFVVAAFA